MKRFLSGLLLTSLSLVQLAFADNFTISKFGGESVGAPDDYIAADFNDELKKANPNAIQDGRFYARQKFEDPFDEDATEYGLYQGKITSVGKAKLGKFSVPNKPYSDVLTSKFYVSQSSKPDQDIDRVYFDGKFVYVEGEKPIYVNIDGTMTELRPSIEKVAYFNVTSQPSGADITINGESKGRTPSKITVMGAKPSVITLAKPGFYTKISVVKPLPGQTVDVGELMTEKKNLENPSQALKLKFLEVSRKKDAAALKSLRETVSSKLDNWPSDSKAAIEKLLANYPPNPSQKGDETADDFQIRTEAWQKDRDAEQSNQQIIADKATEDLRSLLREIDTAMEGAGFSIKHIYISPSEIELGRFNKGKNQFEVVVKSTDPMLSYTWKGNFEMGDRTNTDIINAKDQIQGVIKVWDIPAKSGKAAAFQGIALFVNKEALTPVGRGTYTSPDTDPATNAKGVEFDKKLEALSYSDKNKFDADNETKTLALLQKLESEPVAAVAAPPPPVVVPPPPPPPPAVEEPAEDAAVEEEPTEEEAIADATDTQETVDNAEDREESADDAVVDIDAQFGRGDEYRKWAAWGLVATTVANLTVAVLQHMAYNKNKDSYDKTQDLIDGHRTGLEQSCGAAAGNTVQDPATQTSRPKDPDTEGGSQFGSYLPYGMNAQTCTDVLVAKSRYDGPLSRMEPVQKENKNVMSSYSTGRNIFLGLAALSLGGSIVLFTW